MRMPANQQVLGVLNEVFIHLKKYHYRVIDLFCVKLLTKMKSCTFQGSVVSKAFSLNGG